MSLLSLDFHAAILSKHSAVPQQSGLATLALKELESALGQLAALGHRVEARLVGEANAGAVALADRFPQMLYHKDYPAQTVDSQEDADRLVADGWSDHPSGGRNHAPDASNGSVAVQTGKTFEVTMPGTTVGAAQAQTTAPVVSVENVFNQGGAPPAMHDPAGPVGPTGAAAPPLS